jgi:hypothetical protein
MISAPNVNLLFYHAHNHKFAFVWTDENRMEILWQIGRFAANPELRFNWYDAAVLSQRIRQREMEARR